MNEIEDTGTMRQTVGQTTYSFDWTEWRTPSDQPNSIDITQKVSVPEASTEDANALDVILAYHHAATRARILDTMGFRVVEWVPQDNSIIWRRSAERFDKQRVSVGD